MAGFTDLQWEKIDAKLAANPGRFGCPIRRAGSVILGSFNALKIGKANDSSKKWDFLKRFCSRYDLLSVQEVMDQLDGIRRLRDELGSDFKLIVSDTTGAFPGMRGLRERLAFLYRPSRVTLEELAGDITYDRSHVVAKLRENMDIWTKFFKDIDVENKERDAQGKRRKGLSDYEHPVFSTFIRTPHCAAFAIAGKNGAKPIEFLAVNAHTLWGKGKDERDREFFALLEWVIQRAKSSNRMYFKNIVVLGDLNLNFDSPQTKLSDVVKKLIELDSTLLTGQEAARANFPFLDVHPDETALFRTNARRNQTFDHVAFFIDKNEFGLPLSAANQTAGHNGPNGYDYGVFDFVNLFSEALHDKPIDDLTESQLETILEKARADVSDHMPIWVRIPIPGA